MVCNVTEDGTEGMHDEVQPGSASEPRVLTEYSITVPPLHEGLIQERIHERRLLDFLKATPSVRWLKKIKLCSPLRIFQQTADKSDETPAPVPSAGLRRYWRIRFIRRIDWSSLFTLCKNWLKHPLNIALIIWLLCVAASGAMLILLMLGLLNKAFPSKPLRHHWIEINNQILNALFTLMSIYQHPSLLHHLVLLCRWWPQDIARLRKLYCKDGAHRPRERAHIMVVLALLHVTCISQYVVCGLYWGYPRRSRSEFAENFFFILGIAAPVVAGIYTVYSPLGREVDAVPDAETKQPDTVASKQFESRTVSNPEWAGGLFDYREDPTVCCLSFWCTFCVFGWNMERLGFGNMYVQTVMFLLLCVAPFWVFNITALNIHDYVLGDVVGAAGISLCFFGLLYGGFWRIQMRKKLGLPRSRWCFGSASLTDYVQWLFCWPCALAQEVRTGNLYDVQDDSFYAKLIDGGLENGDGLMVASDGRILVKVEERNGSSDATAVETSGVLGVRPGLDGDTTPPVPPVIRSEERHDNDGEIEVNITDSLAASDAKDREHVMQ